MADLQTWANLAEILGAATVIGGAVFAVLQLRQFNRQRRDAAALAFVSSWDGGSMESLDRVYGLPDDGTLAVFEDAATRAAANEVYVRFEILGMMVHHRFIPMAAANEWAGGAVRVGWRKLRPWIEAKRAATKSERPGEWFQWLAERLAALPVRDESIGAFQAHKTWR